MSGSSPSGSRGQWDDYAEQLRAKLPDPPPGLQDAYCKWIPWLAIIFGAIGLFFLVILGLFGAVISPLLLLAGAEGLKAGGEAFLTLALGIVGSILDIVGGWLMLRFSATGWWIYAVGLVIGILSNLAGINILGLIITLAIGWVHISVKPRYS